MALSVSHKIKRFLKIYQVYRSFSSLVTNPNFISELTKKSEEKTQKTNTIKYVEPSINTQKNVCQNKPLYEEFPIITTELEQNEQLRRKFAKSSTHIALTQPLKLPRLANPFPEPVKTLASDIVADDEKARLMYEQIKMEARYHLQMQQEKLMEQKINKMNHDQNFQANRCDQHQQPNEQFQNNILLEPTKNKQPTYRKPKGYNELQKEQSENQRATQCQNAASQQNLNNQFQNQPNINEKHDVLNGNNSMKSSAPTENVGRKNTKHRSRRRRSRSMRYSRSGCYSKHSRRREHTNPYSTYLYRRFYSTKSNTINPDIITETEQAEIILERLKTLYPEYKDLKKPVFVNGDEAKQFINYILKLLGKHKVEGQIIRKTCPFPSYSEMKTFVHELEPKKQENKNCNNTEKNNVRHYHTKKESNEKQIYADPLSKKLKKYKYFPYNASMKKNPKKQEAPYPAFSELNDNYDDMSLPWRSDTCITIEKKHYSTSSKKDKEKQAKKKPPCKNPFPPLPQCDYEETARKNDERKRKKGRCPNKNKKCAPQEDNHTIINKIKVWLNSCKPDADNIVVTRSPVDVDGRETYVIELNEIKEIDAEEFLALEQKEENVEVVEIVDNDTKIGNLPFRNIDYKSNECKQSHVIELIDNLPVISKNVPDFNSNHEPDTVIIRKPEFLKRNKKRTKNFLESKSLVPLNYRVEEFKDDNMEKIKHILERKLFEPDNMKKVKESLDSVSSIEEEVKINDNIEKNKHIFERKLYESEKINNAKKSLLAVNSMIEEVKLNDMEKIKRKFYEFEKINNTKKSLVPVNPVSEVKPNDMEKIKHILQRKLYDSDKINKVNEYFKVKSKANKMKREINKTNKDDEDAKYKLYGDYKLKTRKSNKANISLYSKGELKLYKNRNDNKYKEVQKPRPIMPKSTFSLSPKKDDPCKRKKTVECPKKKKCRYKKKRKLPSCDDVPKNKTCMPFFISEYKSPEECMLYNSQTTNYKQPEHINLKEQEVSVLANQDSLQEVHEPFKLKPQFWRK